MLLVDEILAEPIVYCDFCAEVPTGAGIGATLEPDNVDFYRCDRSRTVTTLAGE